MLIQTWSWVIFHYNTWSSVCSTDKSNKLLRISVMWRTIWCLYPKGQRGGQPPGLCGWPQAVTGLKHKTQKLFYMFKVQLTRVSGLFAQFSLTCCLPTFCLFFLLLKMYMIHSCMHPQVSAGYCQILKGTLMSKASSSGAML